MLWFSILAAILPLPQPNSNEARILLLRVELQNVNSPGLSRFDQATMLFTHTEKAIPTLREAPIGGCIAGTSAPSEVHGYLAGAVPLLVDRLPGEGIRLPSTPRMASGKLARMVLPLSGAPGVYSSILGGSHEGSAQDLPMFFSGESVGLRLGEQTYSLRPPSEFSWPERALPRRLSRKRPVVITWTPAANGEMWLVLAATQPDRGAHWLVCRQRAERGSFRIPLHELKRMPATESATLLLAWDPKGAWQKLDIAQFQGAWATALHIQGARVELLR